MNRRLVPPLPGRVVPVEEFAARRLARRLAAVRADRRAGRAPDRLGAALAWARVRYPVT